MIQRLYDFYFPLFCGISRSLLLSVSHFHFSDTDLLGNKVYTIVSVSKLSDCRVVNIIITKVIQSNYLVENTFNCYLKEALENKLQ